MENLRKSGKPEKKIYVYDSTGKYLYTFKNQTECTDYYGLKKGDLFGGKDYRLMSDGNYICSYRIGRDELKKRLIIDNNKFCKQLPKDNPVELFNILGDRIGEFRSFRELIEICGIPKATLKSFFYANDAKIRKTKTRLIIKNKIN